MYQHTHDPNVLYPNANSQENNPFGKFTQTTYNAQQNSNMFPFNRAFKQNEPMIERQNFRNQNNLIHNNIQSDVHSEFTVNYTVDIDSKDRNTQTFINPFKYTVSFAPITVGVSSHEEWIDVNNKSLGKHMVNTTYNGPAAPYITKAFKNIKYIRVDSVILPKYSNIVYDPNTSEWIFDSSSDLTKKRYVVMKFTNVDSRYNLSTNTIVESNGIKLIPDTIPTTGNFYYAVPSNANNIVKTYNTSLLGNLDKLYIEFYDSEGNLLKYDHVDQTQPVTDVRNPNNSEIQNNITLVFGIVENEMSTDVKFSQ